MENYARFILNNERSFSDIGIIKSEYGNFLCRTENNKSTIEQQFHLSIYTLQKNESNASKHKTISDKEDIIEPEPLLPTVHQFNSSNLNNRFQSHNNIYQLRNPPRQKPFIPYRAINNNNFQVRKHNMSIEINNQSFER